MRGSVPYFKCAAIVLHIVSCQPAETGLAEDQRAIGKAVEQAWAEMMDGARALDAARIRAGYVAQPTLAVNGAIIENFDTRFEETKHWLGSLSHLDAIYDNVHLEILTPNLAIATMNHHLKWTDTVGVDGEWHSAWTALFRKIDGAWKIDFSHESETSPERR